MKIVATPREQRDIDWRIKRIKAFAAGGPGSYSELSYRYGRELARMARELTRRRA